MNEWSVSNITGDIIFATKIDLKNAEFRQKIFRKQLATRAETQIFPCKNIKIGISSDCFNFLPIFGTLWSSRCQRNSNNVGQFAKSLKTQNMIAFIDRHDVLTKRSSCACIIFGLYFVTWLCILIQTISAVRKRFYAYEQIIRCGANNPCLHSNV